MDNFLKSALSPLRNVPRPRLIQILWLPVLAAGLSSRGFSDRQGSMGEGIEGVSYGSDGRSILTTNDDGITRMWNAGDGRLLLRLVPVRPHVRPQALGLAISGDGSWAVISFADGIIQVWDLTSGKSLWECAAHRGMAHAVAVSPDGRLVASAGEDRTAKLWDSGTGQLLATLKGDEPVYSVAFSPDGKEIATGGYDGVRLWSCTQGVRKASLKMPGGRAVDSVAFSPEGSILATADESDGDDLFLWNLSTDKPLVTARAEERGFHLAFSPDGETLVTAGENGKAALWNVQSGRRLREITASPDYIVAVAFAPDGRTFATAGHDGYVRIWSARTGELVRSIDVEADVKRAVFPGGGH